MSQAAINLRRAARHRRARIRREIQAMVAQQQQAAKYVLDQALRTVHALGAIEPNASLPELPDYPGNRIH